MTRLALVYSHDGLNGRPALVGRLADALMPFFDEVRWAVVSGSGGHPADPAPAARGNAVRATRLRLPQVPSTGASFVDWLTSPAVDLCAGWPKAELVRDLRDAALVVVESGPLAASIDRFRRGAAQADLVYFATGRLALSTVHPRVGHLLRRDATLVDRAVTIARPLLPDLAIFGERARFIPAGLDDIADGDGEAACDSGSFAAVLDAGHFDASVVGIAASSLPATRFHLLGGASRGHRFPDNVVVHEDLPVGRAMRLLERAAFGLVPSAADPPATVEVCAAVDRLTHLGLPIVCPFGIADHDPHLFGYETGRSASIRSALRLAMQARRNPRASVLPSWRDVARCVIGEDVERGTRGDRTSGDRHAG